MHSKLREPLLRATLRLAARLAQRQLNGRRQGAASADLGSVRAWRPGVSVLIPDRASPELLAVCLQALQPQLKNLGEPVEVIVSCSDAAPEHYESVRAAFPNVRWRHSRKPLGYARAIQRGMRAVRYDHVYLLNNDVTLEPGALRAVLAMRGPSVFAVASQIVFADSTRRREETGLTAAYGYPQDLRIYDVAPGLQTPRLSHLYAGGGASLFRSKPLRGYVNQATAYDPVYWEDVEWGWRAAADGWQIHYCAESVAVHRHRETVNRFFQAAEVERIIARNALQFQLRNVADLSSDQLLQRYRGLPERSQRELTRVQRLWSLLRRRRLALTREPPQGWFLSRAQIDIQLGSGATGTKPTLICVSPFALLPTTHGGARRTLELLRSLSERYRVVLVSDESDLYPALAIKQLPWLSALLLVSGRMAPPAGETAAQRRSRHAWTGLREALSKACALYRPQHVLISHEELMDLIDQRQPEQTWTLDLHDVNHDLDQECCRDYAAVLATSPEDLALLTHPQAHLIANASTVTGRNYQPSLDQPPTLLFVGNLRYPPNRHGLLAFVELAWPALRLRHSQAQLQLAGIEPEQLSELIGEVGGIVALGPRADLEKLYADATLTICPLQEIRGSALKIAESLAAGRVCVTTAAGARGFDSLGNQALECCQSVREMAEAVSRLLANPEKRHRRERPSAQLLRELNWSTQAGRLHQIWTAAAATANLPKPVSETPTRSCLV